MELDRTTSVASARASIHREIEEHLSVVAARLSAVQVLRQQLNGLAPISSLPPEIMLNIFCFVKSVSDHAPEWTKVSHVCTYWRKVAVNAPGLWCTPPLGNLPWTAEMLERSKQLDIALDIDTDCSSQDKEHASYKEAFRHTARIRHISLIFSFTTEWWRWIVDNLPMSAPRLETLLIVIDQGYTAIPENVLVDVPNLRRLELTRCALNWGAHWLPQISHLKICELKPELTWTRFLNVLGTMYNLESLLLAYSFPRKSTSVSELDYAPSTHINLSRRLRVLSIKDNFMLIEAFFRYVTFPPETALDVGFYYYRKLPTEADCEGLATILKNIARSYSNTTSSGLVFRTLVLDYTKKTTSNISFGMFGDNFGESAD